MLNSLERGQRNPRRLSQVRYVLFLEQDGESWQRRHLRTEIADIGIKGFYNPVNDSFIEPSHTGISYSFTADGYYEEAYYRAVSNRTPELDADIREYTDESIATNPACPQAIMQFQHGTVVQNSDNSLSFSPFAVDGRQLQSNPCVSSTSTYTRYNQSETMSVCQIASNL